MIFRKFLILTALILCFKVSYADPLKSFNKIGEGNMKFLFWDLYKAELYTTQAQYAPNVYPVALKLTYKRDIKKADLIEATADQWKEIKLDKPQQADWLVKMDEIWPEIKENDVLTLVVNENQQSQFYYQSANSNEQQLIGEVIDVEFGPAFLAIWLSEKTTRPDLRTQLIGASK